MPRMTWNTGGSGRRNGGRALTLLLLGGLMLSATDAGAIPPPRKAAGDAPGGATQVVSSVRRHATLDGALQQIATTLVKRGNLAGKSVLISPNDFYEMGSGRSLPLALVLREKMVTELSLRGAQVLLPGADEDRVMILQGQWQKTGDSMTLAFKLMQLTENGPQVIAADTTRVALDGLAPELLRPDLLSWGRYLARNLERQVRDGRQRAISLQRIRVTAGVARPRELGGYLSGLLRPALAGSRLFVPLDTARGLSGLSLEEMRTRGIRPVAREDKTTPEAKPGMSLTADLLQADGELVGTAYPHEESIELRVHIRDRQGRQIAAAAARLDKGLFPPDLLETPPAAPEMPQGDGLSLHGLELDLATSRGDGAAVYRKDELIRFLVRVNRPAYLYLFDIDSAGRVSLLYPLAGVKPEPLDAGVPLILPDDGLPYELRVTPPYGRDLIVAVATETPLQIPAELTGAWGTLPGLRQRLRQMGLTSDRGYAEAEVSVETREN